MVIGDDPARTRAHGALMGHITDLDEGGQHVPCLGAEGAYFTADDSEIQHGAARLCRDCPALQACGAYVAAFPEPAGAWAGTTEHQRAKRRNKEND